MKTNIQQILDNIRISYEYEMGEYLEPSNRTRHKVELRNALVNAARPYGTCTELAKMVGKVNHTTTIHCIKEHDVYHNFSPQYRRNYAKALEVVEKFARRHQLLPRTNGQRGGVVTYESEIDSINLTILSLQKRRNALIEKLQEKRKSCNLHNESTI
tara:strand:+ start:1055 stop:1525 length:471 start_codon:yes stop_codon:yes gene_type:complete